MKFSMVLFVFVNHSICLAIQLGLEKVEDDNTSKQLQNSLKKVYDYYFLHMTYVNYIRIVSTQPTKEEFVFAKEIELSLKGSQMALRVFTETVSTGNISASSTQETNFSKVSNFEMPINDETEEGFLIWVASVSHLLGELKAFGDKYFTNPRANYVFLTLLSDGVTGVVEATLREMWKQFEIADTLFLAISSNSQFLVFYEPFKWDNVTGQRGYATWVDLQESPLVAPKKLFRNYQQTRFNFSLFYRSPTSIPLKDISPIYTESYMKDDSRYSNGFIGIDALIMANIAKLLNLRFENLPVDNTSYGGKTKYGNYTGAMADVINKKSTIAANARFIKDYFAPEMVFTHPMFFDSFCIIAPKALTIPQYLAIFLCFHPSLWGLLFATHITCGFVWYFLKNEAEKLHHRRGTKYPINVLVLEMWNIMAGYPSAMMPFLNIERVLMAACLLANIIVVGTFQGFLSTAFSTTSSYKDINTLEELDRSGLPIGTASVGLLDLFGTGDSPLLDSLRNKMKLLVVKNFNDTARARKICAIDRKADISITIKTRFSTPDGSLLMHIVDECPRDYHLAYIMHKDSHLLPQFDMALLTFAQAGLITKWYEDVEYAIITHHIYRHRVYEDGFKVFSVTDVQISFFILIIGHIVSGIVFIIELVVHKMQSRRLSLKFVNTWRSVRLEKP